MFEPVPLEMLYSDVDKPQVSINVNGIDAVCPEFNCDYLYLDPIGEITAQSLSEEGDVLTITGTNLPTENLAVSIANSACTSIEASETEITSTLDVAAAAGSWDV